MSSSSSRLTPIFVVGYMHSGTTLMLNILAGNRNVFPSKGETKFFEFLHMVQRSFPNLEDETVLREFLQFAGKIITSGFHLQIQTKNAPPQPLLLSEEDMEALLPQAQLSTDHRTIFGIVFAFLAEKSGCTHWLEKTPTHIFHIDDIVQFIPSARFVEVVRDPRDILASKKTRRQLVWTDRYKVQDRPRKNWEKAYDPLWDVLSWKSAIRAGEVARQRYSKRFFLTRYEDLVTHPEIKVREICDFLELEFNEDMLNITYRNPADPARQRSGDFGISADGIERWRSVLNPVELALTQQLVSVEMSRLSYLSAKVSFIHKALMPILVVKSLFEFFQRLYRRWRLGGSAFLLQVLKNYVKRFRKLFVS